MRFVIIFDPQRCYARSGWLRAREGSSSRNNLDTQLKTSSEITTTTKAKSVTTFPYKIARAHYDSWTWIDTVIYSTVAYIVHAERMLSVGAYWCELLFIPGFVTFDFDLAQKNHVLDRWGLGEGTCAWCSLYWLLLVFMRVRWVVCAHRVCQSPLAGLPLSRLFFVI